MTTSAAMPGTAAGPVVEVTDLVKRYGDLVAVNGVSLRIEPGEVFGMLGPNGAGKTTTVESIAGLRRPDTGAVRVFGLDPAHDRHALTALVGVQLQQSALPDKITVREALELFAAFYPDPADPDELLTELGLADVRRSKFSKLSGGQKQRLSVALALIGKPKLAILDELTTGLDPQARRDTWELVEQIRDRGVTIILVTHFMEEAERLCDRIALIDRGRLVALDSPAGLVERAGVEQIIRFRPSRPLPDGLLTDLPEVSQVQVNGGRVEVGGTGNLLQTVTVALAKNEIVAEELRVQQATLDEAFIRLTGHRLDPDEPTSEETDDATRRDGR